jgi:glycerol uptake facilitator-like aquaporin
MSQDLLRRLVAEFLGVALLSATIVGSGVLAAGLAGGAYAVALIGATIACGGMLYALITVLGPVSGCHINPAVTIAALVRGDIGRSDAMFYVIVQSAAAVVGVWFAHAMFALPVMQVAAAVADRSGTDKLLAEAAATFTLVFVIYGVSAARPSAMAAAVAATIAAGIWWTASGSFANPAITVARSLSDSFAGIRPIDAPGFVVAQIVGAVAAERVARWLFAKVEPQAAAATPDETGA